MSENNKQQVTPSSNDDLLGGDPKAAAATPEVKKPAPKKGKTAEQKRIEAAQDGSDFLPAEKERHLFHVKMDKSVFSPTTGKKLTKEFVQMYTAKEWSAFKTNGGGLGFTTTVLWNPENYK